MCHQSVGLIARQLEAARYPTIGLTAARTITAAANPPRSVFVDLPLGHTSGPPYDPRRQRQIVSSALERGAAMTEPGTIDDLDLRWHHDGWKANPLGWTRRRDAEPSGARTGQMGDSRTARSPAPQYQHDADRFAAEATSRDEQCRVCLGLADPA